MDWFFIIISVVATLFYPLMWFLYFIYGIFEKIVRKIDKNEMTIQQLERGLLISSIIISFVIGIFTVYLRSL